MTAALVVLAWVAAAFALLPLGVGLANLRDGRAGFRRPGEDAVPPPGTAVSILVPARDEAGVVERTVRAALASRGVVVEVVVLDDGSSDATPEIVRGIARRDARVRLVEGRPLPSGWAGKQHACSQLAEAASHEVLVFVDADIVLVPDAAARAAALLLLLEPDLGLVSGFPRQRAETLGERLVVPWIHLLLLGYLPMAAMRQSRSVAFGAGCGQWMVARRDAYRAAGGHGADPLSRHDGLALPRAFRRAGWRTDLFDGSTLAACRMYDGFAAVWRGFGKSAGEGMATPRGLPVWTLLLGLGHVVPWVLLAVAAGTASSALAVPAALGVVAGLAFHVAVARRVGGSPGGAVLHPLGALLVLAIQWAALLRHLRGRPSRWKGRAYAPIGSAGAAADPRIGA